MRDGALLTAFAGVLFLAAAQLSGRRASASAARAPRFLRQRPNSAESSRDDEQKGSSVGRAAAAIALVGMALATVALFGHLIAPVADPLWIPLLTVAFASIPAAVLFGRST